jgi:hypothetical protein
MRESSRADLENLQSLIVKQKYFIPNLIMQRKLNAVSALSFLRDIYHCNITIKRSGYNDYRNALKLDWQNALLAYAHKVCTWGY